MSHEAFLKAIIDAPEDDAPRLAYADWLDEHGQPERAEFIRVQCELTNAHFGADHDNDCTCPCCLPWHRNRALRRRERELLDGVCGLGVEALPVVEGLTRISAVGRGNYGWYPRAGVSETNGIEADFHRGFFESVKCSSEDWLQHGDELVKVAPLREVELTTRPQWAMFSEMLSITIDTIPYYGLIGGEPFIEPLLRLYWPTIKKWILMSNIFDFDVQR